MVGVYGTAKQAFEYWEDVDGYRSSSKSPSMKFGQKKYYLYHETPYKSGAERRAKDLDNMGYAARISCGARTKLGQAYTRDWKKLYFVWAGNK